MAWLLGIGLGVATLLWLASELAVVEEKGQGNRAFFKGVRRSLVVLTPLFIVAGGLYYLFFN
ncbi:hypothetical protein MM221_15700 [Salipaludibacillus sp. LMS25]|jgi:hypothetical protein|uniref:hypothetical protein n=1 Tax=Salipaludibacillus sp. LMS25 TaxID=2924031 RepID=UPI0020D071E9|nr:hypothetical protein [Salipaludibacillus sp. LMS25]UTR14038.1 hypothetical protein MM221_15700 [Salipaludibacillus sp. LMS25]